MNTSGLPVVTLSIHLRQFALTSPGNPKNEVEIAMLYYDQKWKLAYSLIIIRFPFKVHQFKQHWGKIAGEIFLSSVTYLKKANPSCFMLGIQGKGNICPLTLRMFIFTVPEKASIECFNVN